MKSSILAIVVLYGAAFAIAHAQTSFLNSTQQSQFTSDLKAGNLAAVQSMIVETCNRPFQESQDDSRTIDDRFESARNAEFCFRSLQSMVAAQAADPNADQIVQPFIDKAAASAQESGSSTEFMGLTWGLGFGYSFGQDEAIDEADVVDGVVRVKSRKKDQPRAVLEFHKYLWCNAGRTKLDRGCGPFVAVAATQDEALSGVGIGWMYGRKSSATDTEGFSVGIGVILDANVKDLAEGFKENQPPPGTETVVRFEEKSRWSALIIVTRTF